MRSDTALAWPIVFPTYARSQRSGSWSMGGKRNSACAGPADSASVALKVVATRPENARLGREAATGGCFGGGGGGGRCQGGASDAVSATFGG